MVKPLTDPDEAHRLVAASEQLVTRSRKASQAPFSGPPLVHWGVAWAISYPAMEWLATPWSVLLAGAAFAVAAILSWLPHDRDIRTGFEPRIRMGWLVVLACWPFLVATVSPLSLTQLMLLLGALWGLAMAVTAIAMADRTLAAVTTTTVICAGLAHMTPAPLTAYGLSAGLLLAGFGSHRSLRGRH